MATSIKRVVVMILLIDFLLVIIMGIAGSSEGTVEVELDNYISSQESWNQNFSDSYMDTTPDTSTIQLDKSAGDVKFGQTKIFEILMNGVIYPFSSHTCSNQECENSFQETIQSFFSWLFYIINAFALMDIVYIAYSKKYD